jgi:hypothetical protein
MPELPAFFIYRLTPSAPPLADRFLLALSLTMVLILLLLIPVESDALESEPVEPPPEADDIAGACVVSILTESAVDSSPLSPKEQAVNDNTTKESANMGLNIFFIIMIFYY